MFQWLLRLFRRKQAEPQSAATPTAAPHPSTIAVVPYGNDSEVRIQTEIVSRTQHKQLDEARRATDENPELTLSQAHAALHLRDVEPRAEIVIEPEDGMALPVLPADLAPETMAIPRLEPDEQEPTRRLPSLSERGEAGPPGRKRRPA